MTDETQSGADEPLQFPKIEGLADTRQAPKRRMPTCSDCVFFSVNLQNIKTGFCHGNPPEIIVNQREGKVMIMRPTVGGDNIACRHLVAGGQLK